MSQQDKQSKMHISGDVKFPPKWTVFGPFDGAKDALVETQALKTLPDQLSVAGKTMPAKAVIPTKNQYVFEPFYGLPPYEKPQSTFIFVPLQSNSEQEVTIGVGADWFFKVWVNGECLLDRLEAGSNTSPPAIDNYCVDATLKSGENILVVQLVNGKVTPVLALGGPEALRKGDFESILPPPDNELDAGQLLDRYPPDPEAPIRWVAPEGFDPRQPGLGMQEMEAAEHLELHRSRKSHVAVDDGGTGVYESLRHGTLNHGIDVHVYQDRLIAIWHNHAQDEAGPGTRILARVGKVVNEKGDVDWGGASSFVELGPAAVPVRRRKLHYEEDMIREAHTGYHYDAGPLRTIDGRLFFCGRLTALHGVTTRPSRGIPKGVVLSPEEYAPGPSSQLNHKTNAVWDLGFRFYQEWGVRDDRFQPLSPIYKENQLPDMLVMTTELSLPLEPLVAPYNDAPLLAKAPEDFQTLVRKLSDREAAQELQHHKPGTRHLTHDGLNGLAHFAYFKRPDGSRVAVTENQSPRILPFYYAAEKPDEESYFPPARRTNVYGAVKPASGELPDGSVFIVANSPDRRNMYITVSKDGRRFDKSWFLLYRRLSDYTPGASKREGGAGSGPQYFVPAVIGQSLWLIYSISKEHIGATRVPIEALT